jgi:cell division protein FtsI/penicillin-binding protein 2
MIRTAPERVITACCALACCFTAFSFRLVDLQVTRHGEFAEKAAEAHGTKKIISARRGAITDVRGIPLAQNEPVKTVVVDGSLVRDPDALAELLSGPLEMPANVLLEKITRTHWSDKEQKNVPVRYTVLKKELSELVAAELAVQLSENKIRAITFEQEAIRTYPNGDMASHVIGYVDHESKGMEGVERSMNEFLRARDGYRFSERDRTGRELVQYRGQERPARDGCNVQLTIDSGLQMIVEKELNAAAKTLKPNMAACIMMRPQTGEIMALASWPPYNLNDAGKASDDCRKNHAIMDLLEPGSTFKIVPASGALALGLVKIDTEIFCENGAFTYHGNTLHDHKPLGSIPVREVLIHSSNIGAAKLGLQLGEQRLFEFCRRFGFGERTGINLPGELSGMVHPPSEWSKISITHIPMGQEVGVTPIQIVCAMSVIANGGRLMTPQVVHQIVDPQSGEVTEFPPNEVRRVIPEKIAAQVREALIGVVGKKGTAQKAHVPGYLVGGKTGTAQKARAGGKGYDHSNYVVSFVGFMPAEKPEFVCLVLVDEAKVPHNENYGGQVAAPIFARIADRAAQHLNLTPTEPILPGEVAGGGEAIRD